MSVEHARRRPDAIGVVIALATASGTAHAAPPAQVAPAHAATAPSAAAASTSTSAPAASTSASATAAKPEPIRVAYAAPDDCPGEAAFVAQVLARTRLARRAEGTEAARAFSVTIRRQGARVVGDLTVRAATGERSARSVAAPSCPEVVGALALVAALTIDPAASTAPLAPASPAALAPPSPAAPAPAEPARSGAPAPPPRAEAPPALPAVSAPPRHTSPAWSWSASAGLMGGVTGAASPDPMPLARAFATVEARTTGLWSPAATLSAAVGRSTAGATPSSVTFTWISGRLDACPVAWRARSWLALRPCAAFDAGLLRADPDGAGLEDAEGHSRLWLSADALARAELQTGALLVRLEGGVLAPLRRDRFVFTGDKTTVIHQVPDVAGFAALGVGVVF